MIVILTGAGISAESGIKTFRSDNGTWEEHRVEDVATPEGFMRDPELVHQFYNARRAQLSTVSPNAAHLALARLQKEAKEKVAIITQNIDDLHERAGSDAIHMHGELYKIRCLFCQNVFLWKTDCSPQTPCPVCHKSGALRPDIVWFGELPHHMEEIENMLALANIFVAIGTSGVVYPAAGFVQLAHAYGAKTIEINLNKTEGTKLFDEGIYGAATKAVPSWVEAVLA